MGGICFHLVRTGKRAGWFWRSPPGPGVLATSGSERRWGGRPALAPSSSPPHLKTQHMCHLTQRTRQPLTFSGVFYCEEVTVGEGGGDFVNGVTRLCRTLTAVTVTETRQSQTPRILSELTPEKHNALYFHNLHFCSLNSNMVKNSFVGPLISGAELTSAGSSSCVGKALTCHVLMTSFFAFFKETLIKMLDYV